MVPIANPHGMVVPLTVTRTPFHVLGTKCMQHTHWLRLPAVLYL